MYMEFLCKLNQDKQMKGIIISITALILVCLVLYLLVSGSVSWTGLGNPERVKTVLLIFITHAVLCTHRCTLECVELDVVNAYWSQALIPTEKLMSITAFVILQIAKKQTNKKIKTQKNKRICPFLCSKRCFSKGKEGVISPDKCHMFKDYRTSN